MNTQDIIREVKSLELPKGQFLVFGSCPMVVAGIRESEDIDLIVTEEVYENLKQLGWKEVPSKSGFLLEKGAFEVGKDWEFGDYNPTFAELAQTAGDVEGIPIVSLEEVKKWKMAWGREKDLKDVALIEDYLKK